MGGGSVLDGLWLGSGWALDGLWMGRGGLKNLRDPGGGLDGLAQGKCLGDRQGASSQSPDSDLVLCVPRLDNVTVGWLQLEAKDQ